MSTGYLAPGELGTETPASPPPGPPAEVPRSGDGAPSPRARLGNPRLWQRGSLAALLLATGALYLIGLSKSGWANQFYAAAAQSGSKSWKALLFGSLDPSNYITVDKPPASLWVIGLSMRFFGVNSWSLLVPQALEGVAAVALLYAAVRRVSGHNAGLLAGAALASTPVATLMFRFDNPDALLVLLMTAAGYATVRATEKASWRWLALAGSLLGFAFLTKMLQGLIVLPAFALAYLIAAPTGLGARIRHLLIGGAALIVSAGWYVALVELWPAGSRPYIGGSTDNSFLQLVFGYNGFGRITGGDNNGTPGGGGGGAFGSGQTGAFRLFGTEWASQISWLVPAALVALAALIWLTWGRPRTDALRASVLVWGGWLVMTWLVLSYASGIIHPYYTVAFAPGIAGLVGMGTVALWRASRRRSIDEADRTATTEATVVTGPAAAAVPAAPAAGAPVVGAPTPGDPAVGQADLTQVYGPGHPTAGYPGYPVPPTAPVRGRYGAVPAAPGGPGSGVTAAGSAWSGRALAAKVVLSALLAVSAAWTVHLFTATSPSWHPELKWVVVAASIGAILAVLVEGVQAWISGSLVAVTLLTVPAAYSVQTASTAHNGALVTAGPGSTGGFGGPGGRGGPGGAGPGQGGPGQGALPPGQAGNNGGQNGQLPGAPGQNGTGQNGTGQNGTGQNGTGQAGAAGNGRPGGANGGPGGLGGAANVNSALVTALQSGDYIWSAATTGANEAASMELASNTSVMAIGGFNGTDNSMTLAQFKALVAAHKIHYYIANSQGFIGSTRASGSVAYQIQQWVTSNFTSSTIGGTTVYDLTS